MSLKNAVEETYDYGQNYWKACTVDSPVYQAVTPNLTAICLRRTATGVLCGKAVVARLK